MTTTASTAMIRQWARAEGFPVGDRGRLSPDILAAYQAQHGDVAPQATDTSVAAGPSASRDRATRNGDLRIAARPAPGVDGIGRRVRARAS